MEDSKPRRSVRCPHCAGPLAKEMETSDWTLPPLIRDSFSMIGSAVGCTTSAFYGFNHVMPIVQRWVKGPIWLHFLIGVGSRFGESTLKLGSMLTDGQVGRFKDKSAAAMSTFGDILFVQAAGLLSSFTTSRSDSRLPAH